jgi:hypothetical protein
MAYKIKLKIDFSMFLLPKNVNIEFFTFFGNIYSSYVLNSSHKLKKALR